MKVAWFIFCCVALVMSYNIIGTVQYNFFIGRCLINAPSIEIAAMCEKKDKE